MVFGFGISLSLCANIGSAPRLTVFSIVVAAYPLLALLLEVELLNRALKRHRHRSHQPDEGPQEGGEGEPADRRASSFTPVVDGLSTDCRRRVGG